MNFGIKQSNCKFYVNEEKRTVVCVIPNTKNLVCRYIRDKFSFPEIDFRTGSWELYKEIVMPKSFMGKAVCAEGDTWDEELGRMIAFNRAKDKCYTAFFKRANNFINIVDGRLGDMISEFNNFGVRLENRREELQKAIEERMQE